MKIELKSLWGRFGAAGPRSEEPQPSSRREQIVNRQRELAAASVQTRLSRQFTDPPPEEAATPLYDASVYKSSPDFSEE